MQLPTPWVKIVSANGFVNWFVYDFDFHVDVVSMNECEQLYRLLRSFSFFISSYPGVVLFCFVWVLRWESSSIFHSELRLEKLIMRCYFRLIFQSLFCGILFWAKIGTKASYEVFFHCWYGIEYNSVVESW